MNFHARTRDEPEINLIPFIDVLLVVLIFLMLTTTYSKFTELQLKLPVADADTQRDYPKEILISITPEGNYSVNRMALAGRSVEALGKILQQSAQADVSTKVIINADANAKHQAVINVMQAARNAGLTQIIFATQSPSQAGGK